MPAAPAPLSNDGSPRKLSWPVWLSRRSTRWSFRNVSLTLLRRIQAAFDLRVEGFEWKEVARQLHVSGAFSEDLFWQEVRSRDLKKTTAQNGSNLIPEPKPKETSKAPGSGAPQ